MNIKRVVVGPLEENCYIVENNNKCLIIDPGDDVDKIINNIKYSVVGILITHYHFDHIGALDELKEKYNIDENNYNIKDFDFEVIKTPGHTSDSKTYYFKDNNIMFVGDFIFKDSIGRMDLPTGSVLEMKNSISKILKYPSNTILYPGHGDSTTIGNEKKNLDNYFFSNENERNLL